MLTLPIHLRPPSETESEDNLQSSLHALLLDDTQNCHRSPGGILIYQSRRFDNIRIHLPVHSNVDVGRQLFAHYLSTAGVLVADVIEGASYCEVAVMDSESPDWDKSLWKSVVKGSSTRSWLPYLCCTML